MAGGAGRVPRVIWRRSSIWCSRHTPCAVALRAGLGRRSEPKRGKADGTRSVPATNTRKTLPRGTWERAAH